MPHRLADRSSGFYFPQPCTILLRGGYQTSAVRTENNGPNSFLLQLFASWPIRCQMP